MVKETFTEEIYQKVKICDLITVSLYSLGNSGKKITFERLLEKCFDLFPKKFNFPKHPSWPDSRKLDRPLRTLRREKLLLGNPKEKFSLTPKGKKRALQIIKLLRQKKLKLK